MTTKIHGIFNDAELRMTIQRKLPKLFQIAEIESSRAGKIGMEVGSLRERILVALLIYYFGEKAIDAMIPITQTQIDVRITSEPLSIKTITGISGIKIIWTVDAESARNFCRTYEHTCDILLAQIKWDITNPIENATMGSKNHPGGLFLIPLDSQIDIMGNLGRENYLTPPKAGTNPRGIEISKNAIIQLMNHAKTKCIPIIWKKTVIDYNPFKRWIDYWTTAD